MIYRNDKFDNFRTKCESGRRRRPETTSEEIHEVRQHAPLLLAPADPDANETETVQSEAGWGGAG